MKGLFARFFRRRQENDILLHCHVFKNAGTTIDGALERSFGNAFFDHREDMKMRKQGMPCVEAFLQQRPGTRALSSHHMPFAPDYESPFNFNFHRIVMLREPIDRAGSVHAFEAKQRKGTQGARVAASANAREYFEWRLSDESPAVLRSFQVRYLAGQRKPKETIPGRVFETACARLTHPGVSFGLVERFDESMVVIEDRLRRTFRELDLAHVVRNRNREGDIAERHAELQALIGDEMFQRLQDINRFDTALYEKANTTLDEYIAAIPDFEARLADYRKRCEAL